MRQLVAAVRRDTGLNALESWAAVRAIRNNIIVQLNDTKVVKIGWLGTFRWKKWKLSVMKKSMDGKNADGTPRFRRRVMVGHLRLTFKPTASLRSRPLPCSKTA